MRIKQLFKDSTLYLAIVVTIAITFLSLVRINKPLLINFDNSDKIKHAFAYFVLTILWLLALGNKGKIRRTIIISACIAFGMIIEVLQEIITSYRTADYFDALANSLGVLLAMLSYRLFFDKKALITNNFFEKLK